MLARSPSTSLGQVNIPSHPIQSSTQSKRRSQRSFLFLKTVYKHRYQGLVPNKPRYRRSQKRTQPGTTADVTEESHHNQSAFGVQHSPSIKSCIYQINQSKPTQSTDTDSNCKKHHFIDIKAKSTNQKLIHSKS